MGQGPEIGLDHGRASADNQKEFELMGSDNPPQSPLGPPIKLRYEKELLKGMKILAKRLSSESLAWAFICLLMSALVMARTMPTEKEWKMGIDSSKQFLKLAIAGLTAPVPETVSKRRA